MNLAPLQKWPRPPHDVMQHLEMAVATGVVSRAGAPASPWTLSNDVPCVACVCEQWTGKGPQQAAHQIQGQECQNWGKIQSSDEGNEATEQVEVGVRDGSQRCQHGILPRQAGEPTEQNPQQQEQGKNAEGLYHHNIQQGGNEHGRWEDV